MDNFGFIHGELDTKLLILFILRRLPRPVDGDTLTELCFCDTGVSWFEYSQCLADLVDTGHIDKLENGRYMITEKGDINCAATESSLPYSVRTKAERLIKPIAAQMKRDALIVTEHRVEKNGCFVKLSLSDGEGDIINMTVLVSDEACAQDIEQRFRRDAEIMYGKIVNLLTDGASEL